MAATQLGIPGEILDVVDVAPTFTSANTAEALRGTGITVPEFASYAPKLWRYWADHLDPIGPVATIRRGRWSAST
jgi:thioester reductase-like protein